MTVLMAVAGLALCLPPAAAATPSSHAPAVTANSTVASWAYGGDVVRTVSASGPNGSFSAHYYFAWKVIENLTNTSSTTYQLEVQRWMIGVLDVAGQNHTESVNLTVSAWDNETGFANLTTASTVDVNGTAVAAVGLMNESARGAANVTEALSATWTSLTGQAEKGNLYASVAASAQARVAFSPPIGLFPMNPTPGQTWTSSSNYTASGLYSLSWHIFGQVPGASYSNTGGGSPISVSGSGPVTLQGADLGVVTFPSGATSTAIGITWEGAFGFDDHEGIILLPHDGDVFDNDTLSTAGATGAPASAQFGTNEIDVSDHQIVASRSAYSSSSVFGSTPASGGVQAQASTATDDSSGVGFVQADPISVADAENPGWCLSGCSSPTSPHNNGAGIIIIVAAAVVVVVGAVMWTGRRKRSVSAPANTAHPAPTANAYGVYQPPSAGGNPPTAPPNSGGSDPVGFFY